jgi:hypothetical protein
MLLLASILLILLEAISEGLADRGKKTIAGIMEFFYRAMVTFVVFAWLINFDIFYVKYENLFYIIGGYLLLRFAIFDIVYNLVRGLPFFFIGTTKVFDKTWQWFFKVTGFPVNHFFAMTKFLLLLIAITWLLKT